MKCGSEIVLKDAFGSYRYRFVAQCEGRYFQISNQLDIYNGVILQDWRYVLHELVALTVPAKLRVRAMQAQSTGNGKDYVSFPLIYPLPVKELARLMDVGIDDVRDELSDLAVDMEEPHGDVG